MASSSAARSSHPFLLRLPASVYAALQTAAAAAGLSLNEYCTRRLAAPATSLAVADQTQPLLRAAADLLAADLAGIILYGSWARGETVTGSDVDVLVVVERSVPLVRALYRRWDAHPVVWDGRPVDPHFVHVPRRQDPPTGVWAEAAIAGVVLFERDERISRHLARVRAEIAEGRLTRRIVHGQPYWTLAA